MIEQILARGYRQNPSPRTHAIFKQALSGFVALKQQDALLIIVDEGVLSLIWVWSGEMKIAVLRLENEA